jgi:hypothetical protein
MGVCPNEKSVDMLKYARKEKKKMIELKKDVEYIGDDR